MKTSSRITKLLKYKREIRAIKYKMNRACLQMTDGRKAYLIGKINARMINYNAHKWWFMRKIKW